MYIWEGDSKKIIEEVQGQKDRKNWVENNKSKDKIIMLEQYHTVLFSYQG